MNARTVKKILRGLKALCPRPKTTLRHKNPFELLIATILSAQCTDKRVNIVTAELFRALKKPEDFISAGERRIERHIKTCGLYRSKSKNIIAACKKIIVEYKGKVPEEITELCKLPGVGRKTANVVASQAFGIAAIAVDTHVFRVSTRIGLASARTPEGTERELQAVIPRRDWAKAHIWLIHHGRTICRARRPDCARCPIQKFCRYFSTIYNRPLA